ncbi:MULTISPECIES: hypothetical protein [Bacillus]|uniref:hypothetical protein n=1 Tax=Bacillus TaxID=1386 RepID=UPI000BFA9E02|nr:MULTISPECIES: hypothetical protein [Bacillus]PFW05311.1 hypothetical protein COL22_23185 [Bacillus thuringiensis]QEQ20778.1 hypothetical protein F0362_30035 [Bacillus sp. BS98]
MGKENTENELIKIDKELELLKIRQREIIHQDGLKKRKERTKRLIQTGALCEKYFEISHLDISDREEVFKIFSSYIKNNLPQKYKQDGE